MKGGIVGESLQAVGEGGDIAHGDYEPFDATGEEVFAASVGGAENGAAAGESLSLDECETLFNTGKDHDVTGAHEVSQFLLREGAEELDVLLWEAVENSLHVGVDGAGEAQAFCGMTELGEGLEEVGNSLAEGDRAGEEYLEAIPGRLSGAGELFEPNAVGDDVHLAGGYPHFDERAGGEAGGDRDGVGGGVDLFFAEDVADVGDWAVDVPSLVFLGDDGFLVALMRGSAVADEEASAGLDFEAGFKAGAGDGDDGVGCFGGPDSAEGPLVKGERVGVTYLIQDPWMVNAKALHEDFRGVNPREGFDDFVG